MRLFDTHTHLYDSAFDEDRAAVIRSAKNEGVCLFMLPNEDSSSLNALWHTHSAYPDCTLCAIGLHPTSVKAQWEEEMDLIEKEIRQKKAHIAAIGEIGLDLYWDDSYKKEQCAALARQIELSIELDLPVILHVRKAFEEIFQLLDQYPKNKLRGVFHCFDGSESDLTRILSFPGMMIGVNGIVTFKRNTELRQLVGRIPLDRILLETDAPYLAPEPERGKRNESAYIVNTLKVAAQCLKVDESALAEVTYRNALSLFRATQYIDI